MNSDFHAIRHIKQLVVVISTQIEEIAYRQQDPGLIVSKRCLEEALTHLEQWIREDQEAA